MGSSCKDWPSSAYFGKELTEAMDYPFCLVLNSGTITEQKIYLLYWLKTYVVLCQIFYNYLMFNPVNYFEGKN